MESHHDDIKIKKSCDKVLDKSWCAPFDKISLVHCNKRISSGRSLPSWLSHPGPVLIKRHVRNKPDDLVDEVQLLRANSHYAEKST